MTVVSGPASASFAYNGLGDRLRQTVNSVHTNYILDLNAGLTQVLSDGTNTYLYGLGRIGEHQPGGFVYHFADALGSVRQLTNAVSQVTMARSYAPFGSVIAANTQNNSVYGFTGEWTDSTGLVNLRARYFLPGVGRFISKDTGEETFSNL